MILGNTVETLESFFWLVLNVYFEARDQPELGRQAVTHVVMNRAHIRGQSVVEVITASKQFSWYNGRVVPKIEEPEQLPVCVLSVVSTLSKRALTGYTFHSADHYHTTDVDPYWDDDMREVATLGDHIFFTQ